MDLKTLLIDLVVSNEELTDAEKDELLQEINKRFVACS